MSVPCLKQYKRPYASVIVGDEVIVVVRVELAEVVAVVERVVL